MSQFPKVRLQILYILNNKNIYLITQGILCVIVSSYILDHNLSQKRNNLHITPFWGLYELMSEWTMAYNCEIVLFFKLLFLILHLVSYLTK